MAYRKWHELPNRHNWVTIRALAGIVALTSSLHGLPILGQVDESKKPSIDRSPAPHSSKALPIRYSATPDELKVWIDQLGSPQFSVRERAVMELSRCDASAVAPLRKAAKESDDLEVQSRCLAIADAIYELDVGKRTTGFLRDPDPNNSYGFDGWPPFAEIVGKSRVAKRLFTELIAAHPDHANSKPENPAEFAAKTQRNAAEIFNKFRTGQNVELGDSVSLIYDSIRHGGDVPRSVEQVTVLLLRSAPLTIEISRPPMRTILQKLIGAWTKSTRSDPVSVMMIGIDHGIPEAIDVARNALRNRDCEPNVFAIAISAVMRFGNDDDLDLLEPWIKEHKLILKEIPVQIKSPMAIPPAVPPDGNPSLESGPQLMSQTPMQIQFYELRYQDLALAASAHLLHREDMHILFPRLQLHPTHVFIRDSLAFPKEDDEARQRIIDALASGPRVEQAK